MSYVLFGDEEPPVSDAEWIIPLIIIVLFLMFVGP